jgi:Tfp pilus assembly protein PilO
MTEATTNLTNSQSPEAGAAARARLRALVRQRPSPRELVKTVAPLELAVVVVLLFAAVAIVLVYSFSILPDQVRVAQLSNVVAANRTKIAQLESQTQNPGALREEISVVRSSLDTFRSSYLKPRVAGRLAILETVRNLTRETGVQLASAVSFTTKISDGGGEEDSRPQRRNQRSSDDVTSFSSLAVELSIQGAYPQLRNFINGFERSAQFVVIDSISLSTEEEELTGDGARRGGAGRAGDTITLNFSMTAYFQPDQAVETTVPVALEPEPGQ